MTNTGDVEGDEVQLYVRDLVASVAQPVRRLRAFRRVTLSPGETAVVEFVLGSDDLAFWVDYPTRGMVVEPGDFDIFVGGTLDSAVATRVTVAKQH